MKRFTALILALLMALSLCACGSKSADGTAADTAEYGYAPQEAAAESVGANSSGFAMADKAAASASGGESSDLPDENPEKIIYSADVTVETTVFDDTLSALDALVKDCGGWVESSSINGANYYSQSRGYASTRSADYTLRIPSGKFDSLMNSLTTLGNVPYSYTYTENVSSQYYDVQARLTAYTTQEARLLEMMEQAETVADVITIEDRLTELRYQIESLQSTLNNWDRRVSYSTVNLSVQEVSEYSPDSEAGYGQQLWLALTGALKDMGEFFKNLLVFLVSALPTLIILAVLLVILLPLIKKQRAKRRAKKQAKDAPDTSAGK